MSKLNSPLVKMKIIKSPVMLKAPSSHNSFDNVRINSITLNNVELLGVADKHNKQKDDKLNLQTKGVLGVKNADIVREVGIKVLFLMIPILFLQANNPHISNVSFASGIAFVAIVGAIAAIAMIFATNYYFFDDIKKNISKGAIYT